MRLPRLGTAAPVAGLRVKGDSGGGAPRCAAAPGDTRSHLDLELKQGTGWEVPLQRGDCPTTAGMAKADHLIH